VGPITIYFTSDAGTSWDQRLVPALTGAGATVFGRRDEVEEVMLQGAGTQIVRLEDGTAELVGEGRSSSSLSPVSLVDGLDYATSGSRGWIAGRSRDHTSGVPVVCSAVRGAPWVRQPVEFDGLGALHAIDFSDARNGVTCGSSRSRTAPRRMRCASGHPTAALAGRRSRCPASTLGAWGR